MARSRDILGVLRARMTAVLSDRIDSVVQGGFEDLRDSLSIPVVGKIRSKDGEVPRTDSGDMLKAVTMTPTVTTGPTTVAANIYLDPSQTWKGKLMEKGRQTGHPMAKRPWWTPWMIRFRARFSRSQ